MEKRPVLEHTTAVPALNAACSCELLPQLGRPCSAGKSRLIHVSERAPLGHFRHEINHP
jgi:hypothetical protein